MYSVFFIDTVTELFRKICFLLPLLTWDNTSDGIFCDTCLGVGKHNWEIHMQVLQMGGKVTEWW